MAMAGDGKRGETTNTFTEETPRAAEAGRSRCALPDSRPRPPTHAAALHGAAGQLVSDLACLPKRAKRSHFSTDFERVLDILVVLREVAATQARKLDVPQFQIPDVGS